MAYASYWNPKINSKKNLEFPIMNSLENLGRYVILLIDIQVKVSVISWQRKQKHNMTIIEVACTEDYVVTVTYNAIQMKDIMMLMQIK